VNNRSSKKAIYRIEARQTDNRNPLVLKGQTRELELEAGENLRIDFVLVTPVPKDKIEVEFILLNQTGDELAITGAYIK